MRQERRILVTAALPYANGDIHLGHLLEYVQTDIWTRFQRLRGHRCYYVCAEDTHGTPIMLRARQEGATPEAILERMAAAHRADFADFEVAFDSFYTTHSPENRALAEEIYRRLREGGHLERRTVRQAYDESAQMFLPDRFIRGTCPVCGAEDQYGDSCEVCGSTYSPTELKNPRSVVSGEPPVERDSEHLFLRLCRFAELLEAWIAGGSLQPEVRNKLKEWLDSGLHDWDISRDAPYWGFEIPDDPGKYFYVWFDAPIGYLASFQKLCERQGIDFDGYWAPGSDAEVYHFIGKDIMYFHCLFWPSMLAGAGYRMPTAVYCHGFLTVNGQRMSKSRGTFLNARTYLDHLDPECLRYYYAAKLSAGVDDIDLNLDDFVLRVNSDLVGKLVNIASRCAGFISRGFDGRLAAALPEPALYEELVAAGEGIAEDFEGRHFSRAVRSVMALADRANQYIDEQKPWQLARTDPHDPRVQAVATQGLNLYRLLITYLKPVLPRTAERSERFLASGPLSWASLAAPLLDHRIGAFEPLLRRVERDRVEAMLRAAGSPEAPAAAPTGVGRSVAVRRSRAEPGREEPAGKEERTLITIDQFAATELKVGTVKEAAAIPGSQKLLKLTVDLGEETPRTVVAGIARQYEPAALVGRQVVVVANLQPAKLMGVESQGMVLAAEDGGPVLLEPERTVRDGTRIR